MIRDFSEVGLKAASLASASLLSLTAGTAFAQERAQPEAAEAAREELYQRVGLSWALNAAYLKFYGF